ncbi:MAG: DUF4886 domain-containing protein [Bacteroidaceae bacterium]|nr:DUF4886 domain-containing protein [Bacteroidaceae bacterium]
MFKLLLRHVPLFAMLSACLSLSACKDADELNVELMEKRLAEVGAHPEHPYSYIQNHPLPLGKQTLKVLSIGNSFTQDALWFVSDLLETADVDAQSYSIYYVSHEAASLQYWWGQAESGTRLAAHHLAGLRMTQESGTLAELLAQDWDVITLQQNSENSILYASFHPYLHHLIDFIQQHCLNPDVTLAWLMAWSYNDGDFHPWTNYERWLLIARTTVQMVQEDGIDVVIPVGTAIQNARKTTLNSKSQLTSDGWHLDTGIGRYIAACTWVETLFGAVYGMSVNGNTALTQTSDAPSQRYPSQPVTEENRPIAWQCAIDAVVSPFQITPL